jgi:hypothetical protein
VPGLTGSLQATVLDEDRTIQTQDGAFSDDFQAWDVHLYRLATGGGRE